MNDDLDLIERLRTAGTSGPSSRHTPDAVLAAGRRAQSRRTLLRAAGAALSVAAVVAVGMQLTPSGTQTVTAAGDGAPADAGDSPAGKPVPRSAAELDRNSDRVNAAILQAAMGDDFAVSEDSANGKLRDGTASAAGLPSIYSGTVSLSSMVSNGVGLKQMCAPFTEKGVTFDGCVTRSLPDGRDVQVNFSHWAPTAANPQDTAGESVRVLFLQPNGLLAWTDLVASADADDITATGPKAARVWLDSMVDRLGTAAADPDVAAQGFDGDHCDLTGDTWTCEPGSGTPADPAEKKAVAEKKAMAEKQGAEEKQAITEKQAIAEKQAMTEKQAAEQDGPTDKAAAVKKAEAEKMAAADAEKAALAEKMAAADEADPTDSK